MLQKIVICPPADRSHDNVSSPRDSDVVTSKKSVPVGTQTLQLSRGSIVVTIPPPVFESISMAAGDGIAVDVADESITLTRISGSDIGADTESHV